MKRSVLHEVSGQVFELCLGSKCAHMRISSTEHHGIHHSHNPYVSVAVSPLCEHSPLFKLASLASLSQNPPHILRPFRRGPRQLCYFQPNNPRQVGTRTCGGFLNSLAHAPQHLPDIIFRGIQRKSSCHRRAQTRSPNSKS